MDPIDLSIIIPSASKDDIDFIKLFLQLDPSKRIFSKNTIELNYFRQKPYPTLPYLMSIPKSQESFNVKKTQQKIESFEELIHSIS